MISRRNTHIKVECFRFDPAVDKEPHFQAYEVPLLDKMSVHDCLLHIRENLDPSLAYFINCKRGTCGRCLVRVNSKSCLACVTEVNADIRVEPLSANQVIRDLWVESL